MGVVVVLELHDVVVLQPRQHAQLPVLVLLVLEGLLDSHFLLRLKINGLHSSTVTSKTLPKVPDPIYLPILYLVCYVMLGILMMLFSLLCFRHSCWYLPCALLVGKVNIFIIED